MKQLLYNLPREWRWFELAEVSKIQSGTGFPKLYQGATDEEFPFLKVSDMNLAGNESKITRWNNTISQSTATEIKAKIMPSGTVIFPKIGAAIATNKKRILTKSSAFDNNVMGLLAHGNLTANYLYWYLQGFDLSEWASSAALPSMKASTIKEHKIPVPPINEQKRIVAKLDALFTRIDTAISHLQETLKLSKSLFASALDGTFVPTGDIERPPKTWTCELLATVSNLVTDGTHHSPKKQYDSEQEGLFKYVTSKNIKFSGMKLDGITYIPKAVHDEIYARCNPEYLDQLITKDGAMTGTCCLNILDEPYSLLSSVALVKLKRELMLPLFLNYYLQSPTGQELMIGDISGAAITRTNLKKLKAIKVPLPPMEEQKRIVVYLDALADRTRTLEAATKEKLDDLSALKASLLDAAFRGHL